jgi:chromosome segregation ATPase
MLSDRDYTSLFSFLESISNLKAFKQRLSDLQSLYNANVELSQKNADVQRFILHTKQDNEDAYARLKSEMSEFTEYRLAEESRLNRLSSILQKKEEDLINLEQQRAAYIKDVVDEVEAKSASITKRQAAVLEGEKNLKLQWETVWALREDLRNRLNNIRVTEQKMKKQETQINVQ